MLNPHSRIITRDRGLLGPQLRRYAARFYRLGSDREDLIERTLQAVGNNLDQVDADKILFLAVHRIFLADMRIRR
jgi:hypothetical protein